MIVKNESKIIVRLLKSVIDIIDTYCIVDTGSTDATIDVITNFFNEHNIFGKIISEPFQNFEYNRNFALETCLKYPELNADYILLLDADMVLILNNYNDFKEKLTLSYYYIFQGSESFYYKNVRIVKNEPNLFKYVGYTHEVIVCSNNNATHEILPKENIFIKDIGDGGSKNDKYIRDIKLLSKSIEEDPKNSRSYFYLANSYFDIEEYEEAIKIYKKRIELNGWNEEIWYSYYKIGIAYKYLGNSSEFIMNMLMAYEIIPNRLENIYEIICYYRRMNRYKTAFLFYNKIKKSFKNKKYLNNFLFFHNDVYDHKILYEYLIIAYYNDITNVDVEINLILNSNINEFMLNDVFNNIKYYIRCEPILENVIDTINEYNISSCNLYINKKIKKYIKMTTNSFLFKNHIYNVATLSVKQNNNKYLFIIKSNNDNNVLFYSSIFYHFIDDNIINSLIIDDNYIYVNKLKFKLDILNKIKWFDI
jgi:tetratricopeptide (TPR) repeat protein